MASQSSTKPAAAKPRRRLLKGCLVTLLVSLGGCGLGLILLVPEGGPPVLSALSPKADVVLHAREAGALWEAIGASPRAAAFRGGPAWGLVRESPPGREVEKALARAKKAGIEITRSRASHLVGREVGLAAWLPPGGGGTPSGKPRDLVAALRIDTYARIVELAAGRLFMRGKIRRREERGAVVASLSGSGVHWSRLGDLLLVSTSEDALGRAVASALASGGDGPASSGDTWSAEPAARFGIDGLEPGGEGFQLAARIASVDLAFGGDARLRKELEQYLRAFGVPTPITAASVSFRAEGGRILEEDFLETRPPARPAVRAAAGRAGGRGGGTGRRPASTFVYFRFRPGKQEAVGRLWRIIRQLVPARAGFSQAEFEKATRAGVQLFRRVVLPRVGDEITLAVAEQDIRVEGGGFPAQFLFFRVSGAGMLRGSIEELLRARSLGVYGEADAVPSRYPYLVRRRSGEAWAYEMVIRNARRHEGYRPALALLGDDLVYTTSFEALDEFLKGGGEARRPPADPRPDLEGPEVLRLEWRAPRDFRPLRNAYDYFVELGLYRTRDTASVLDDGTDYDRIWKAAESALLEVRAHERTAVREKGGVRVRAVWDLGE